MCQMQKNLDSSASAPKAPNTFLIKNKTEKNLNKTGKSAKTCSF